MSKALQVVLAAAVAAIVALFWASHQDRMSRSNKNTVSEEQWDEFSDAAGCRPVRTGASWRTVSDDGVTYKDQGSIITYNCEGRSITARQFP